MVYAIGSGLIEVLCSPIVEACPFENKDSVDESLHSFYCWGSVGVIVLSTAFFAVFSIDQWKWLACLWALVPLYNVYNFMTCPIENLVEDGNAMGIRGLLKGSNILDLNCSNGVQVHQNFLWHSGHLHIRSQQLVCQRQ